MVDIWVVLNFALAVIAIWVNWRRTGKENLRRGLRISGLFIALYVAVVYGLVILGVIPEFEVRLWMRFFQAVILAYLISEALNG
ncbi:hypothetical protein EHM92_02590 [bacterium]|nr:MAG: hypothetical protein EHM92_02590 [bacterium]